MRQYYVEVRRVGTGKRELIRARGRRDARKLAGSVNREHYRARVIELKG